MVSFPSLSAAIATIVAVSATTAASEDVSSLPVGAYFRPTGSMVSGVRGTAAPFRRSPCPALNTLANHGYLPRNGQNVTLPQVVEAVMTQFNMDASVAAFATSLLPEWFDLDILGVHNYMEHDASLVHADAFFNGDPSQADARLLEDFLGRASDTQPFIVQTLGEICRDRLAECVKTAVTKELDHQRRFGKRCER